MATVLSVDDEHPYDVIALNAASAALMVSPIPFLGPIGAVLMAFAEGAWIPMATYPQMEKAVFTMVVVGKRNAEGGIAIAMVEAGATENALRLVAEGQAPVDEATVSAGTRRSQGAHRPAHRPAARAAGVGGGDPRRRVPHHPRLLRRDCSPG